MSDLRDLGLSDYEARAYRTLLAIGAATARELSDTSEVPMGRIYDVLNGLETHGLVRSQTVASPKRYVAVDPEDGLDRLLAERERELEETRQQYAQAVSELKDSLDATTIEHEGFWTAAVGPEEVLDLLCDRLDVADTRIVMVVGPVSAGFDVGEVGTRVTDRIAAAAKRGVTIRVLAAYELAETLPRRLGERYSDLIARHDNVAVRVSGDSVRAVTVIDAEVCVEVPNPIEPTRAFAMINVADPQFAGEVRQTVDARWDAATPL
jgi:sugar-specific transcriptional regulator TrmB